MSPANQAANAPANPAAMTRQASATSPFTFAFQPIDGFPFVQPRNGSERMSVDTLGGPAKPRAGVVPALPEWWPNGGRDARSLLRNGYASSLTHMNMA